MAPTLARTLPLALALALVPATPPAHACGSFFSARVLSPEERPSLAREKVLLIHDAATMRQHFIREVAFRRASEPFGFVVPTPTRPEVAAVEHTPFTKLRQRFPFSLRGIAAGGYGFGGGGMGSGGARGVEVLAVEQVGSFTAFVLAADDAAALAGWLRDNQLVSTPDADRWLAHYVRMGFFYVAMRYDPPKSGARSKAVTAETIRISFDTPLPYYPYLEPDRAGEPSTADPRLLELWLVAGEPHVPVALREHEGERRWLSPFEPGQVTPVARRSLERVLRDELEQLLPAGELVLQTFQDQKRSRLGWSDVVFAPTRARELAPAQREALLPLLGSLDPALVAAEAP